MIVSMVILISDEEFKRSGEIGYYYFSYSCGRISFADVSIFHEKIHSSSKFKI